MVSSKAAACAMALILVQVAVAHNPVGYAEEVLHKNSLQPRRNSKAMSFMEYFFPPSRTPKVSDTFDAAKPPPQTEKKTTVPEQTTNPVPASTQDEGRATTTSKRGTTTKRKTSQTRVSSTTPKTRNSTSAATKQTQKATTSRPKDSERITTAATQKTTNKHYTIYPTVVMSKTNPPTSIYKSTTEKVSSPTTSKVVASTQGVQKVTLADLAKVSESVTEKIKMTSAAETAATDVNGREGELELKDKMQQDDVKIEDPTKNETVSLPAVLAKPTKYHYYPHNQHIYLLPECAIQQVCNAVYVRLNYTQPLCACPTRHRDPCSASLNADDLHTTQLTTDSKKKYAHKAITLVKTCEATSEMRECRSPRDWSLLALQNIRTGKSHYLVICRCPEEHILEGPMSHDQPTYASVPGIRVYGMMCVQPPRNQYPTSGYNSITGRPTTNAYKVGYSQPHYNQDQTHTRYPGYIGPGVYYNRMARKVRDTRRKFVKEQLPPFPWEKARELALSADWEN